MGAGGSGNRTTKPRNVGRPRRGLALSAAIEKVDEFLSAKSTEALTGLLIKSGLDELPLPVLQIDDAVFNRILDKDPMYLYWLLLTDSVSAIYGLHLDEWVPVHIT
jgi:hypothetical protein